MYYNLGGALNGQRQLEPAVTAYRKAINLKPDFDQAHLNLGAVLYEQRKVNDAVDEFRNALRLNPNSFIAHCNIGEILQAQGDYAGGLAEFRKGHEIATRMSNRRYPTAQMLANAERLANLAERLPELLKADLPKDATDCLDLAKMCRDKKLYTSATRFLHAALEADPKLGDDREAPHRYDGACAAALAAEGQGQEEPPTDESSKAKLRGQALQWLKDELATWAKLLESAPPKARPGIVQTLDDWRQDPDFASLRDPKALAKLPEAEQKTWQSFWADLEALLKKFPNRP
jgi:tetratricopeptide (TPR) repeat protein